MGTATGEWLLTAGVRDEKGKADIRRWIANLEDSLGEPAESETEVNACQAASLSTPVVMTVVRRYSTIFHILD